VPWAPASPRLLHPVAWWLWAAGLATAASRTTDPLLLGLVIAVAALVVAARRGDAPWAGAYRTFLLLGLVVIAVRTVGAVLLGTSAGTTVVLELPQVPLPGWFAGIRLGGPVTAEGVAAGATAGLQLATLLACVGAANSLAHPLRLLKVVPGALHEVGVAVVVAVTTAPSLLAEAARVRAARRLRGRTGTGLRALAEIAVPVLHGGLERSLALAASMDARGYGRVRDTGRAVRVVTAASSLLALTGVLVGVYGLLDAGSPPALGLPPLGAGVTLGVLALVTGSRRNPRTRYRPDPWRGPEWAVSASGAAAAASVLVTALSSRLGADQLQPPSVPLPVPGLPALTAAGILLAALPAVLAPPPVEAVGRGAVAPSRVRVGLRPSGPHEDGHRSTRTSSGRSAGARPAEVRPAGARPAGVGRTRR